MITASILFAVFLVFQPIYSADAALVPCGREGQPACTKCDIFILASNIINFIIFTVTPAVAVLLFLIAGFMILLGGANPGLVNSGKGIFKTTVYGLLIIFGAWMITNSVLKSLAGDSLFTGNWNEVVCVETSQTSWQPPLVQRYSCNAANQCVADSNGPYSTSNCDNQCSASSSSNEDLRLGQPLASELIALGISFSTSADCGDSFHASQNIRDIAAGRFPAICNTDCACVAGGPNGDISVHWRILEGLRYLYARMRDNYGTSFRVTSITTGQHSDRSSHYTGEGVDIVINSSDPLHWQAARAFLDGFGGNAICERKSDSSDDPECNLSLINHIHWTLRREIGLSPGPSHSTVSPLPTMADIKIEKITDRGGRVSWNKGTAHSFIAYDAVTDEKTADTELYIMNQDGSGVRCVTCASTAIPKGFIGQPDWHPNGEYLVIQAENQNSQHKFYNHMAWGINQDLWFVSRDGAKAEKIWGSSLNNAALHPHFNQEGNKIGFSERIATGKSRLLLKLITPGGENPWEGWQIHIADFDINKNGEQKLSNPQVLKPNGNGFYEFHGFLPNNDIIYSFTSVTETEAYVDDGYVANLNGQVLRNLTSSPGTWDEHSQYSPTLKSYAFMSSRFDSSWQAPKSKADTLKTELYLRDRTGKITKLTNFNESSDGKRYLVSDFDWDREGRKIVFQVAPFKGNEPEPPQIWMLTFPEPQ